MHAPEDSRLDVAAAILRSGGLVAMPTETVYGLAADATNDAAVARIFEAKGRPAFNPLIAHVSGVAEAELHAEFCAVARRLAAAFWPGPLTLVLPRKAQSTLSLLLSAGLDTVALRMPAHGAAQALIRRVGRPLAAPSANRSGAVSPTRAEHVAESLGARVDMILDAGPAAIGVESTIVKVFDGQAILLRPGGATAERIEQVIGAPLARAGGGVEAPGMLASHYAPDAPLRLDAETPAADEFFLDFGLRAPDHAARIDLSPGGDLREAAAHLFSALRRADAACRAEHLARIAAAPIPETGLGLAINDRLRRAAAPRA